MLKLLTDPRMSDHRPPASHPERPERLATAIRELRRTGQFERLQGDEIRPATDEELLRVHSRSHLEAMKLRGNPKGSQVEADTWLSEHSDLAARLAAGAVVGAIDSVVTTSTRRVFCLVRPPGHHARPNAPMGFCLYASVAVGAADAIHRLGLERVLIVDWDVHHGNGTQEVFYDDPRVGFFSIHRHPFYPGSGTSDETGTGPGLGTTRNVPIAFGMKRRDYLAAFRSQLESFADRIKPELILLSAGFDAHIEDPVGNLGLETEDFIEMTQVVKTIAEQHTQGKFVSVLEGGYNVSILAGCISQHLNDLEAE